MIHRRELPNIDATQTGTPLRQLRGYEVIPVVITLTEEGRAMKRLELWKEAERLSYRILSFGRICSLGRRLPVRGRTLTSRRSGNLRALRQIPAP